MTTEVLNGKVAESFLSQAHRRELTGGSGLTDATIRAAGIYTEVSTTALSAMLNQKYPAKYGAALVIPYRDESGTTILRRVKPSNPPKDARGKPKKYLHPMDTGVRVYFPPGVWQAVNDPTARLILTEGEKKSLAATQAGFNCVSLPGVNTGQRKESVALCPDLDRIVWQSRETFIAFDSDADANESVELASRKLAAALADRGAKVRIVRIPSADDGGKQGVDDFLVAKGPGEFEKLLKAAHEPEPADAGELKDSAKNADPASESAHILDGCQHGGLSRLRYWRGGYWWWHGGCYRERPTDEVRGEIVSHLSRRWKFVGTNHITNVAEHLRAKSMLSSAIDPGTWLGKSPMGWEAADCIATKSEVIHLPSLIGQRKVFSLPATPALFTTTACDFSVDTSAPKPERWLSFLDSLWHDDQQSIDVLQEIFGYLLTADTSQQKMFMLVGPKRSGKGTIARVLTSLVGKGNVVSPTLSGLTGAFGLQPLLGKSVAIIADARLSRRPDEAVIVERLLSVSGEDTQTVERKHQTSVTCKLPTRFLVLTNELPRLNDASGAVVSRIIMLSTMRSFYGHEDHRLIDKLLPELPGIFLWAVGGWARLQQRGRFVQPDSSLEALGELNDLASPVGAFVRDCCNVGPAEVVPVADLFTAWRKWCESQGRDKFSGTVQTFARDLLAVEPGIRRRRVREGDDRTRIYEGIGLKQSY
jgi:putative DNA primase/helicase